MTTYTPVITYSVFVIIMSLLYFVLGLIGSYQLNIPMDSSSVVSFFVHRLIGLIIVATCLFLLCKYAPNGQSIAWVITGIFIAYWLVGLLYMA